MILTLQEAKDILKIDYDDEDMLINELIQAIPGYLKATTGNDYDTNPINPLVKTVSRFLIQLWYEPNDKNSDRLKRIIDGMLIILTSNGKGIR